MRKEYLLEIATFAYILLFSYAAASKLFEMDKFEVQMKLQPINSLFVPYLIWGIPIALILIVVVLLSPRHRVTGLKMAIGLMFVFTSYIALAEFGYFKDRPCTCAGVTGQLTWGQHLIFNLLFLLLGILAIRSRFAGRDLKLN